MVGAGKKSRSKYIAIRGGILTKAGSSAQIGICGSPRKQIAEGTKNVGYRKVIAVSCVTNKSPTAPTSSYVGIQALFYGFDMARMLKGRLSELTFGNMGLAIPTYARNDNSDALYQVD